MKEQGIDNGFLLRVDTAEVMRQIRKFRDCFVGGVLFELEQLPANIAMLGIGVIGLELYQALSRLDIKTTIIGRRARFGGLSDPEINDYIVRKFTE